jgi:hypothetical protein
MADGVGDVVEGLRAAVDDVLALAGPDLSDGELHRLVVELRAAQNRLAIGAATVLSAWESRAVWCSDGSRSAAHRLARETHCSVRTAKIDVQRARKLESMPATREAVLEGRMSLDHVDLLGRANQPWRDAVFADHEHRLVEQCAELSFHDAGKLVAYWIHRADAEAAEEHAEREYEAAHLHASATLGGAVAIDGVLDPLGGAVVQGELARLERELYLADKADGTVRTAAQRRAAALVEMAKRSAAMPAGATRPRVVLSVLLGDDSFRTLCELSGGVVTTPGQVARWLDSAVLETVLFDGPSTVISVSRKRNFSGAVRRAIEVRDRRCQHPSGCDEPADRCDADHIVPFAERPETSQFNGRLECPPHNRNRDRHDHGAVPFQPRPVDRLDELRVRLRWRNRHLFGSGDGGDDDEGDGRLAS